MGSGRWDTVAYAAATTTRRAKGVADFAYSTNMAAQPVEKRKAHPDLDPNGLGIRECRDNDEHPLSTGISVLFDVTGSMSSVPQQLQKRLPDLLETLLLSGYVDDPMILMGAVGDGYSDRVPLQVGQFESDNRIDEQLRNVFLERGGGGTMEESYELALFFAARHTALDCVEKRDHKGFLFIVGDELPYATLRPEVVKKAFGSDLTGGEEIPVETLIAEAQAKYNVFYITPNQTSYYGQKRLVDRWEGLLGANYIQVDDPEYVVETISMLIGLTEGNIDLDTELATLETTNKAAADTVKAAVTGYAAACVVAPVTDDPDGDTVRI